MGLATTIARRSLVQRPGRTFFSVVGVAVGIAIVVAIFTLDHNTMLSRTPGAAAEWSPDLEVTARDQTRNPRESLFEVDGIERVSATFQQDVLFRPDLSDVSSSRMPPRVRLVALEIDNAAGLGAYQLFRGQDIDTASATPQALIGRDLAERYDLRPGDPIYLSRTVAIQREVCIDGEIRLEGAAPVIPAPTRFDVAGVLERESLGRKARGEVVILDYTPARALVEGTFVVPTYFVKSDPRADIERIRGALAGGFEARVSKARTVGQEADERAFRNGVRLAGMLALVLGLFVIFHTLSMSLLERVREVAVLNSLGTTRGQIGRVFFSEAFLIATFAGALGLGGGLLLARLLLLEGITTLGRGAGVELFDVPWVTIGPLVGIGVGIALAGSVFPLLRARGTDTVRALRGEDLSHASSITRSFHVFTVILLAGILPGLYLLIVPVLGEAEQALVGVVLAGLGILAMMIGVPLLAPSLVAFVCRRLAAPFERRWPLAGKLAARSMEQSPSRIAAAVAAIALVTSAFVGLKGMTNSLRAETEVWAEDAIADKVFLQNLPPVPFDQLAALLHEVPGVEGVEPGDFGEIPGNVPLIGLRASELGTYGPCVDPAVHAKFRDGHGTIVSRRLANQNGLQVGDDYPVKTRGPQGQTTRVFEVVAISDAYGYTPHPDERAYAVVSDVHLENYFCLDTEKSRSVTVRVDDPDGPALVEAKLAERFPNAKVDVGTGRELLALHLADITRDFFLFDIIFGLTAILAALGVLNGQLLAAMERAKELGVLRALGMTRRQVAGMVLLECCVVGACGGLLGLAVGGALTPVIVEALQVISDLPLPHRSAGAYLGLCLGGALLVTVVAGVYPIWRMNRLDAVRAVRTG